MSLVVFIVVYILTAIFGQSEPLRRIPGSGFILVLLFFTAFFLLAAMIILTGVVEVQSKRLARRICDNTITHTEMPHLLKLENPRKDKYLKDQKDVWINGYYLLRLYLRGIVRYEYVQPEQPDGEEAGVVRLRIDEQKLENAKSQGGRHSVSAIKMVIFIRNNGNCSIKDILLGKFNTAVNAAMPESDGALLFAKEIKAYNAWNASIGCILAGVMGFAWGLGQAKLLLGISNDKPSGYLAFVLLFGAIFLAGIWDNLVTSLLNRYEKNIHDAVRAEFSKAPHEITQLLVEKVNTTLPLDMERNQLLNAYLYESMTGDDLFRYALNTPENTFMECLIREIRQMQNELYASHLKALEAAKSSDSSGCSSCGGCGGCGRRGRIGNRGHEGVLDGSKREHLHAVITADRTGFLAVDLLAAVAEGAGDRAGRHLIVRKFQRTAADGTLIQIVLQNVKGNITVAGGAVCDGFAHILGLDDMIALGALCGIPGKHALGHRQKGGTFGTGYMDGLGHNIRTPLVGRKIVECQMLSKIGEIGAGMLRCENHADQTGKRGSAFQQEMNV